MSLHHVLQDFPDHRVFSVDDFLRRLHCLHDSSLDQFPDDEWLVELGSHELRQAALVHVQLRTDDDHRTC